MAARDWRRVWEGEFVSVRDQLRDERRAGRSPRRGLGGRWSDEKIDRYAREEASRRCERAIRIHNEAITCNG